MGNQSNVKANRRSGTTRSGRGSRNYDFQTCSPMEGLATFSLQAAGGNAASLGRCLRSTRGKMNQGNYMCVSTLDYDHRRAARATLSKKHVLGTLRGVSCWQTQFGVCPMVSLLPGALSFSTISNLHCGRACMSAATVFGLFRTCVSKFAVASARNKNQAAPKS